MRGKRRTRPVVHYRNSYLGVTACGKTIGTRSPNRFLNASRERVKVTCKTCRKALKAKSK